MRQRFTPRKTVVHASRFGHTGKPLGAPPPGTPDFRRIPAPVLALILSMANRACQLTRAYRITDPGDDVVEANPELVAVDIACVHLCRDLDLMAFFNSDDLTFFAECVEIQKHINRATKTIHPDVRLRFARKGANPAN